MSDALRLPPRPNLEQYKKLAKEFQRACNSREPGAIRVWAVRALEKLAGLQRVEITPGVREEIEREAQRVERRWHKLQAKKGPSERCSLTGAQFFVAREHGFASWPKFARHIDAVARANSPTFNFEAAVDAIVSGDAATLKKLLRDHPELARGRSTREHRSTLLHYVSANGVEDFRQKTPKNIVEIAKILLDAGADVNATSDAYGGGSTALGLVATSLHPERAGVQIPLLELLLERGAKMEQPGTDGQPAFGRIKGCLANGQGEAARFFANRGAHMDLEEAAGVGWLDIVRNYFDDNGALRPEATRQQLESGFLYACGYGHTNVVEFLLERGVDPGLQNEDGQTGLHWAAMFGHPDTVKLLLTRKAPLEVKNVYGSSALEQTLWSASHDDKPDGYIPVIETLVAFGAKVPERHPPISVRIDELLSRYGSVSDPRRRWYYD